MKCFLQCVNLYVNLFEVHLSLKLLEVKGLFLRNFSWSLKISKKFNVAGMFYRHCFGRLHCIVTVLSVEANYSNRRMCILFSCSVAEFEHVNL